METGFGSTPCGSKYSQDDHVVADKLAEGLYGYLDRNCNDAGAKRVKIELMGKQLSLGASGVYKTALELFNDYSWCIKISNAKNASIIEEHDEILRDSLSSIELSSSSDSSSEESEVDDFFKEEHRVLGNMREALQELESSSSEEEYSGNSKLRSIEEPFRVKFKHDLERISLQDYDEKIADKLAKGRIKSKPTIYGVEFCRLEVSQTALEALKRYSEYTECDMPKTKEKGDPRVQTRSGYWQHII